MFYFAIVRVFFMYSYLSSLNPFFYFFSFRLDILYEKKTVKDK